MSLLRVETLEWFNYLYLLKKIDGRCFELSFATMPIGFLSQFDDGVVLDEIQKAPELFSYLQEKADNAKEMGKIVLTDFSQFFLRGGISQSLHGGNVPKP